jgi:lysozyme
MMDIPTTKKVGVGALAISLVGLITLGQFEGYTTTVYKDVAGISTVCTGAVTRLPVRAVVTDDFCGRLDRANIGHAEAAVKRMVRVPVSPPMYDALVSLTFNVGERAVQRSTLMRQLNSKNYARACAEFSKWNKARVKGRLVPIKGLTARREQERKVCESGL